MSVKKLRRLWARFVAGHDWDPCSTIHRRAEFVTMSIESLIMNFGRPAESSARKHLADQLAAFLQVRRQGRG